MQFVKVVVAQVLIRYAGLENTVGEPARVKHFERPSIEIY